MSFPKSQRFFLRTPDVSTPTHRALCRKLLPLSNFFTCKTSSRDFLKGTKALTKGEYQARTLTILPRRKRQFGWWAFNNAGRRARRRGIHGRGECRRVHSGSQSLLLSRQRSSDGGKGMGRSVLWSEFSKAQEKKTRVGGWLLLITETRQVLTGRPDHMLDNVVCL